MAPPGQGQQLGRRGVAEAERSGRGQGPLLPFHVVDVVQEHLAGLVAVDEDLAAVLLPGLGEDGRQVHAARVQGVVAAGAGGGGGGGAEGARGGGHLVHGVLPAEGQRVGRRDGGRGGGEEASLHHVYLLTREGVGVAAVAVVVAGGELSSDVRVVVVVRELVVGVVPVDAAVVMVAIAVAGGR